MTHPGSNINLHMFILLIRAGPVVCESNLTLILVPDLLQQSNVTCSSSSDINVNFITDLRIREYY